MDPQALDRVFEVKISESAIRALVAFHGSFDPGLISDLKSQIEVPVVAIIPAPPVAKVLESGSKYEASLLGQRVLANTLPELFGMIVDLMDVAAPEALVKLSEIVLRTRRYVAKQRSGINPKLPDLSVRQTKSGWWIDGNVGRPQVVGAMKDLARVSGLIYGRDLIFSGSRSAR